MSESIYKNIELENEVSPDMSFFWYSDVHWGLLCPPSCCIESHTIPSHPLSEPGHSSGLYKGILTANGLPISPLSMWQPTQLPGPHTGVLPS